MNLLRAIFLGNCFALTAGSFFAADKPDHKNQSDKGIDQVLTPKKSLLLADGKSRITISETGSLNGVRGTPKFIRGDLLIDIMPKMVIASHGHLFHVTTPHDYQLKPVFSGDVGSEAVSSCKINIRTEKAVAPVLTLRGLTGKLAFELGAPIDYESVMGRQTSSLQRLVGMGLHFLAVRITGVSYFREAGKDDRQVDLNLDVITNFGVKQIVLKNGETSIVKIGPEIIRIRIISFDGKSKVELGIQSTPETKEAAAIIVHYDANAKN